MQVSCCLTFNRNGRLVHSPVDRVVPFLSILSQKIISLLLCALSFTWKCLEVQVIFDVIRANRAERSCHGAKVKGHSKDPARSHWSIELRAPALHNPLRDRLTQDATSIFPACLALFSEKFFSISFRLSEYLLSRARTARCARSANVIKRKKEYENPSRRKIFM